MRVLVAFDKFKDALTAPVACDLAAAVIAQSQPDWSVTTCPLADGGEGFAPILTHAVGGTWHEATVTGPRGAPTAAGFGLVDIGKLPAAARTRLNLGEVDGPLAVIEMATASGLQALTTAERDPWHTTSRGTGELITAAVSAGAAAALLGVGGSATNDVGLGALAALGWRVETAAGESLAVPYPHHWTKISRLDPPAVPPPVLRIACDVNNPLLGPRGATAVFGPQKGLRPADFDALEAGVARVATLIADAAGRPGLTTAPGAGAAGGIAYGLLTAAGAKLVPGFDLVEEWLDLDAKLTGADLVITGEGRFDESSLEGKGPGSLATRAAAAGKPVWIFAGSVERPATINDRWRIRAITPAGTSLPDALAQAGPNLTRTVAQALAEA